MIDPASFPPVEIAVGFLRLPHGKALELPAYETDGAAGFDLRAALPEAEPLVLQPLQRALIPTGFIVDIPRGHEGQVRPRSGLALKHGITCLNTPGTIDWDYRGELKVLLVNLGSEAFTITRCMRIAQMVVAPVTRVEIAERAAIDGTARGEGGFGSTGTA